MVRTFAVMAAVMGMTGLGAFAYGQEGGSTGGKILVAYFSRTNNTATVARFIQAHTGADIFQVEPKTPYPADYQETTRVAQEEQRTGARPELASALTAEEMAAYDTVFIGFPSWWGTLPMPLFTFLERYDFSGKTVVPFCTHGGSGLGRGPADITRLCPGATVQDGLAIRGTSAAGAEQEVAAWLRGLGYAK